MIRTNAMDQPRTPDSLVTVADHVETLESLENGYVKREEFTASPRSYLSMPSCKQFPSMRSVEPLSRVLEPVMVISEKCLMHCSNRCKFFILIKRLHSRSDTWTSILRN